VTARTTRRRFALVPAEATRGVPMLSVAGGCALIAMAALAAPATTGNAVTAVNLARQSACRHSADPSPLRETRALDGAAAQLARGVTLHNALAALESHPQSAAAVHLKGISDERGIARALANRFFADIGTPEFREIGVAWAGTELFIVVAAPMPVPALRELSSVAREVLRLVNAARAQPRRCGRVSYPATTPVTLSPILSSIAEDHSSTMAARDDLQHEEPDGSTPAVRVRRSGYVARIVGENVASGVPTAAAVVSGWLDSPGHCANIMDGRFTEMGIAYVLAKRGSAAIYWTQLFARPRA
jgi:uncharacterized protein YkwD